MPTDYDSTQFVESFRRARRLTPEFVDTWAGRLAVRVPAEAVSVVLDVGAGTGRFWPVFDVAWSPRAVVALDRSLAMLRGSTPGVHVSRLVGDLDALPVGSSGQVDVAFCSMALHYSRDQRECVARLVAAVRPGGWLCVRTGTVETLASFDFLRFFPTALEAERRAMPTKAELLSWLEVDGVVVQSVEEVAAGPPTSRRDALRAAHQRGFPSLQLVPRRELVAGLPRYAVHLAWSWVSRVRRPSERSVLLTARRLG